MNKTAILFFCLFGFAIRVVYVLVGGADLTFPDEKRFLEQALSIQEGNGLRFKGSLAFDMPATALVIWAGLSLSSGSLVVTKLLMAGISALTVFLTAKLCFIISQEARAATITAGICSIYPFFIFYSALLLSETIFLFFFVSFLILILDGYKVRPVLQGIVIGLMHLTKPVMLFFLPALWIWQAFVLKIPARVIAVIVITFLIVISPWIVRNFLVFDSIVITTTSSGQVLWEGNNPWNTTGGVSGSFDNPEEYLAEMPMGLTEIQRDVWKKDQAKSFIMNNPTLFLENALKKFVRFWNIWPNSAVYDSWGYKLVSISTFGSVLFLALFGYVIFKGLRRQVNLAILVIVYLTALHMITIGSIRYRLPIEPILIVVASLTVSRAIDRLNKNV